MVAPLLSKADVEREATSPSRKLDAGEIEAARECGHAETFEPGQFLYRAGQQPLDCFVIVAGQIEMIDPSGDEPRVLLGYGTGGFTGDITVLTQRASSATCRALTRCETIRLTAHEMRHLMVKCPSLGEKWIPALLRRRELLESFGVEGLRVFGERSDLATLSTSANSSIATASFIIGSTPPIPAVARPRRLGFSKRNHSPFPSSCAREISSCRIPPFLYWLSTPASAAKSRTKFSTQSSSEVARPDSALPIYAASEGLRTFVLDNIGPGGQAGSSARIENYAGFPAGLSGRELALRAYVQALKFGATFSAPHRISSIKCLDHELHEVRTEDEIAVKTKTVIIATGVSYRSLGVVGLTDLHGSGVYYAATQVEAMLCQDRPVHIIGAGNSAGQAAMYLSKFSKDVSLVVRGGDLRKNMSTYLSERVQSNPRVNIRLHTELRKVEGTALPRKSASRKHLHQVKPPARKAAASSFSSAPLPAPIFLGNNILKDDKGFVVTGNDLIVSGKWPLVTARSAPARNLLPRHLRRRRLPFPHHQAALPSPSETRSPSPASTISSALTSEVRARLAPAA